MGSFLELPLGLELQELAATECRALGNELLLQVGEASDKFRRDLGNQQFPAVKPQRRVQDFEFRELKHHYPHGLYVVRKNTPAQVIFNSNSCSQSSDFAKCFGFGDTLGLQVCKWYLLLGLKSINRTYFGLFWSPRDKLSQRMVC